MAILRPVSVYWGLSDEDDRTCDWLGANAVDIICWLDGIPAVLVTM